MGRCAGVQYSVVGQCDNVTWALFRGKMQRCYEYPPTPLSEHKVMYTAHGPFFARLRYYFLHESQVLNTLLVCIVTFGRFTCSGQSFALRERL